MFLLESAFLSEFQVSNLFLLDVWSFENLPLASLYYFENLAND